MTRSRPCGNCYSYLRDMCNGTLLHPPCIEPVFQSGKTQKADGVTKILGRNLQMEFVTELGLCFPSYLRMELSTNYTLSVSCPRELLVPVKGLLCEAVAVTRKGLLFVCSVGVCRKLLKGGWRGLMSHRGEGAFYQESIGKPPPGPGKPPPAMPGPPPLKQGEAAKVLDTSAATYKAASSPTAKVPAPGEPWPDPATLVAATPPPPPPLLPVRDTTGAAMNHRSQLAEQVSHAPDKRQLSAHQVWCV